MACGAKTEVAKHVTAKTVDGAGALTLIQRGWMTSIRRTDTNGSAVQVVEDSGKRYAVLATEQKEVAQAMTVTNTSIGSPLRCQRRTYQAALLWIWRRWRVWCSPMVRLQTVGV